MNYFLSNPYRRMMLLAIAATVSLSLIPMLHRMTEYHTSAEPPRSHSLQAMERGGAAAAQSHRPAALVRPVACEKLADIPGKSITTVIVDFPPGAYTPRHRHPGSVTAFVLKGSVRSELAGGPAVTYTVAQTWFEPRGTIHLFAENASSTEPAQLLATFIADDDCGPLTLMD
jgi:quercetin dioxygenase-like cupin family protein